MRGPPTETTRTNRRLRGSAVFRLPLLAMGEACARFGADRRPQSSIEESRMCRNIRNLFNFEPPVTEEEIRDASLQFVRKISGFNKPSKVNEAIFHDTVEAIARISGQLLASLQSSAAPRNREEEAAKARARAAE